MFDTILEHAASRFGISPDKAQQLLAGLTALIFSPGQGGPSGFVDRLRSSGLGDVVQSWIGNGPNQPVSPSQLESALGQGEIASIATRAGLDTTTTSNALSGMLPDVFNRLTEDGQLPTTIPASLGGLLGGVGNTLGDFGRSGAAAVGAGAAAIGAGAASLGAGADNAGDRMAAAFSSRDAAPVVAPRSSSKWPLWILLLAIIAGLAWYFMRDRGAPTTDANLPAATVPAEAAPETMPPASDAANDAAMAPVDDASTGLPAADTATPPADAGAELDKLAAGQGEVSADALVKALNLMIIHFDTGSARISADSMDILGKAAAAIKQAPAGTKIEVGGHTDNTGNAASNQTLSQARAEAVAKQLGSNGVDASTLSSKGYGQDKPVADNGTEAGRASNRRIEFTVQP